jgi:hypothetical protein
MHIRASKRTENQIEDLCRWLGETKTGAMALAVDRLHQEMKKENAEMDTIKIEWSGAALWGSTDADDEGYDEQASEDAFVEILNGYLMDEYPNVDIEIVNGINDRVTIDGMDDHDEVPAVEDLISKTYNGNWEVCKSS